VTDRWFTPDTARLALDDLRPAAETLCRLYRTLERARPGRVRSDQPVDPLYFGVLARFQATLDAIRRRGVRVDDLRQGRLGFPARRAGRRVVLCWEVGEATVGFWYELDAGPDRRLPVDDDGPWDAG
jgi:hypothetical protein